MPLQLILGNSGSGKSSFLYQKIIEESRAHPEQNYLVIVPEQFTMQTQKDLVTMHPDGGIMNVDVLSFPRLAHRVFEEVGEDARQVLTETGKNLMLRRIALLLEDRLPVLGSRMSRTGYVSEVKSVMSELMQYEVGEEDLETMIRFAKDRPALRQKLQEIREIYGEYLRYRRDAFVKPEELLDLFCESAFASDLLKKSVLAFDGFTGFTPAQLKTLRELAGLVKSMYVTVTIDANERYTGAIQEHELFALSKKTIQALLRTVYGKMEVEEPVILGKERLPRFREGGELEFLERHLFRSGETGRSKKDSGAGQNREPEISLHASANPAGEVAFAARTIRGLVTEKGLRYREIAIITGDLSSYGHYVKKIFPRYEIPVFLDETRRILLNPGLELIRGALEAARKNLSYETMFRYLRTGMAGVTPEETDVLENYVLARGIRGWKRWNEPWTKEDAEREEPWEISRKKAMEKYRPFGERVRGGKGTVRKFAEAVLGLLEDCEVQQKLKDMETLFRKEGKLEQAREYSQVYPVIVELLDEMVELLGEETVSLEEFSEILDAGFDEAKVGIIPPGIDQVQVGDIERSRLAHVKVLFFLGLNDGWVPSRGKQGGLVSDLEREILEGSGVALAPGQRENSYIQRFYLYQNLTKPEQKLILSWCRGSSDGKAMRPSYLVDTVRRLFPQLTPTDEEAGMALRYVTSPENGMEILALGFQEARLGREKPWWRELYRRCFAEKSCQERVERLTRAAFSMETGGRLSYETSRELYGSVLKNSVTRLEQFAACAFAHFAAYGLKLKEREQFEVKPADLGILFHRSMELFSRRLQAEKKDWAKLTRDEAEPMLEACVDQVAGEYGFGLLHSSARAEYTVRRIKRILCRSVWAMQEQIRAGSFRPKGFEISFKDGEDLDSVRMELLPDARMELQGRIDRIDTAEEEGNIYVKIVDYKSGNARFDPVAVYYGLQLQLLAYLNAALEMERKQEEKRLEAGEKEGRESEAKKVIPAGVFYCQLQDPVLEKEDGDSRETSGVKLLKAMRPQGLVNASPRILRALDRSLTTDSSVIPVSLKKDGTPRAGSGAVSSGELEQLCGFVERKIREMGREILEGEILASPLEDRTQSACDNCVYGSVCGFDRKLPGQYRPRKVSVSKAEAWERMTSEAEEKGQEGGEADGGNMDGGSAEGH